MMWLDTQEKIDWFLNGLENNEIQLVSSRLTKEDEAEISREIAEYRAAHPKTSAKEAVLA
jgi:hypothetical protein